MTEYVAELYPIFLEAGYSPQLFYDSTIGEIIDLVEAYSKREQRKQKQIISTNFVLAQQIADVIACLVDKKHKPKTLFEQFPELFEEEIEATKKIKIESDLQKHKAQMMHFALLHNSKNKK